METIYFIKITANYLGPCANGEFGFVVKKKTLPGALMMSTTGSPAIRLLAPEATQFLLTISLKSRQRIAPNTLAGFIDCTMKSATIE